MRMKHHVLLLCPCSMLLQNSSPPPSPIKKIYPLQLSIAIGKWNLQKIPSNLEYLTSEGRSLVLWGKFRWDSRKGYVKKNLTIQLEKGFSSQIRSPSFRAWLPINLGLHIEFSIFDNSANRSVYYFSSLNRLPKLREYINSNRWPMLLILRKLWEWSGFIIPLSLPSLKEVSFVDPHLYKARSSRSWHHVIVTIFLSYLG